MLVWFWLTHGLVGVYSCFDSCFVMAGYCLALALFWFHLLLDMFAWLLLGPGLALASLWIGSNIFWFGSCLCLLWLVRSSGFVIGGIFFNVGLVCIWVWFGGSCRGWGFAVWKVGFGLSGSGLGFGRILFRFCIWSLVLEC